MSSHGSCGSWAVPPSAQWCQRDVGALGPSATIMVVREEVVQMESQMEAYNIKEENKTNMKAGGNITVGFLTS